MAVRAVSSVFLFRKSTIFYLSPDIVCLHVALLEALTIKQCIRALNRSNTVSVTEWEQQQG